MKQYITTQQLNELSNIQKEKLRTWLIEKDYIEFENEDNWEFKEKDTLLSIGQMIELLDENGGIPFLCKTLDGKWQVYETGVCVFDQLCDSLWEAVKEVLNDA